MLRYWLAVALVIGPCLGLAIWTGRAVEHGLERDAASSLATWREVAAVAAGEQWDRDLKRIRDMAAAAVSGGQGWGRFATLAAEPAVTAVVPIEEGWPSAAQESNPATLGDHPALLAARHSEFVVGDLAAAAAAYHSAIDSKLPAEVRDEAWAGLVSCHFQLGDRIVAADFLHRWLAEDPPQHAGPAVSLALEMNHSGIPLVDALLAVWRLVHEQGRPCARDQVFALDQAIRDQASSFTPAQRSRWEERSHTLPVEERSLAWWAGLDHQDREQVQRAATVMRPVFDAEVVAFAVHDAERARSVVVAVHMPTFVAQVGAALGNHPTLVRLATAVRGHGQDLPSEGVTMTVQGVGPVAIPIAMPGGEPWLGSRAMTRLLVIGAVVAVLGGCLALAIAAGRDLRLARLKTDFVSNVSHELKTPISLVRLYGEMLAMGYCTSPEAQAKAQAVIVSEAERLGLLVENVLDFARIERGERSYATDPVDLVALIERVVESYRPQLEADGFAIEVHLAPDLPALRGDAGALTQVLLNLLANASKFSPVDKHITVDVSRVGQHLRWTVTDRGIGIPVAEQAHVFDAFYRVETGLSRQTRGSGLGLALVRHIITGHGGTVVLDSAVGRGTTVIISLPIATEPACPTPSS